MIEGVEDYSDLLVRIKNNLHLIAVNQNKVRLAAYKAKVEARDGVSYASWQYLPIPALRALDKKLEEEVKAIALPPKAIAKPVDVPKVENDFF